VKDEMVIIDHEHAGLIAKLSDHCLLGSGYGQRCRLRDLLAGVTQLGIALGDP
jgi:hypothetical protein